MSSEILERLWGNYFKFCNMVGRHMNVIGLRGNIYIFLKLLRLLLKGTFPCFSFFSSRHVASLLALLSISTEGLLSISESL